jgi:hypothetical protein
MVYYVVFSENKGRVKKIKVIGITLIKSVTVIGIALMKSITAIGITLIKT